MRRSSLDAASYEKEVERVDMSSINKICEEEEANLERTKALFLTESKNHKMAAAAA